MAEDSEQRFSCLYFGYASNLSARTLKQRCPESAYAGLGVLRDYRWIINGTGYANIVPSPGDVVYGSLAFLSARDEAALDLSEGVPWMYEKHTLQGIERIGADGEPLLSTDGTDTQKVAAVAYVDVKRTTEGKINPDYVIWCNRAASDAAKDGLPAAYVKKYLRPFVPERAETEHDKSTFMLVS